MNGNKGLPPQRLTTEQYRLIKSRFRDLDLADAMLQANEDLDELSAVDLIRVLVRRHARAGEIAEATRLAAKLDGYCHADLLREDLHGIISGAEIEHVLRESGIREGLLDNLMSIARPRDGAC